MAKLPQPPGYYLDRIKAIHLRLRGHLVEQLRRASAEELSAVAEKRDGDTIYRLDEKGESVLFDECEAWAKEAPLILVAEGLPGDGARVFPEDADPADAAFRMIVDPIDGTRGLMYDKRSAWVLTGLAPNRADATLADVAVAVQTELPTSKQRLADVLWAVRGEGARAERHDLDSGEARPHRVRPTRARSVRHGFATISKFFPGGKALIAAAEERLFEEALGRPDDGNPLAFDDEYISTGGQLYELATGHDRFIADIRPLVHASAGLTGERARLCCHPYDLAAELIAREAGCLITDETGGPLRAPLDITADVCWIGYANEALRGELEPTLLRILNEMKGAD